MKTISQMIKIVQSLVPAVRTSTTSSETVVDTAGFNNVCWEVLAGALTTGGGTPETYVCQVYENDANSTSGAVAITGAAASVTAANQTKKIQVNALGTGVRKRYQFLRITMAGSSPSIAGGAAAILALKTFGPAQDADANV